VTVDQVEVVRLLEDLREFHHVGRERIAAPTVQPQGAGNRRHDGGRGARVAACEESDRVAPPDLFLDQIEDDPLGTSVKRGRHALVERSDMSDSHAQRKCKQIATRSADTKSSFERRCGAPGGSIRKTLPVRATDPA
jgi:hypothetical protein